MSCHSKSPPPPVSRERILSSVSVPCASKSISAIVSSNISVVLIEPAATAMVSENTKSVPSWSSVSAPSVMFSLAPRVSQSAVSVPIIVSLPSFFRYASAIEDDVIEPPVI